MKQASNWVWDQRIDRVDALSKRNPSYEPAIEANPGNPVDEPDPGVGLVGVAGWEAGVQPDGEPNQEQHRGEADQDQHGAAESVERVRELES